MAVAVTVAAVVTVAATVAALVGPVRPREPMLRPTCF